MVRESAQHCSKTASTRRTASGGSSTARSSECEPQHPSPRPINFHLPSHFLLHCPLPPRAVLCVQGGGACFCVVGLEFAGNCMQGETCSGCVLAQGMHCGCVLANACVALVCVQGVCIATVCVQGVCIATVCLQGILYNFVKPVHVHVPSRGGPASGLLVHAQPKGQSR